MDSKEEIRSRLDIVDYISAYVRLTKKGKNYLGLCPFHSEKTPSFNVNREQQWYKCFGCGEGGDIFKFVMKTDSLTFREALERLADKAGVKLEDRGPSAPSADKKERARAMHQEAARFYAERLWNTPAALEYARQRGLRDESIRDFGVGWAPDEWEALTGHLAHIGWTGRDVYEAGLASTREGSSTYYDRFRGRLMFPIFDIQNRVIAFGGRIVGDGEPKYLNSSESAIFYKSGTLYALNFANKPITEQDRVLVMEGYMDVIAAHQAGFGIAVATLGTSLTPEHVAMLARKTKHVILSYDGDSAGVKATLRAGPMFEDAGMDLRLLILPDGHDPDSYIKQHGSAEFAARLNDAVPLMDFQLSNLRAGYDLATSEGRTEYVNACLPVLVTLRSNVTRDRYVRHLAELWAQGDMSRVAYREEDIRRDLASLQRRKLAEQRAKWHSPQGQTPAPGTLTRYEEPASRPEPASGISMAERVVLRALLLEPELVRPLHIQAEEFSEGPHRQIATLALQTEAGEPSPLSDVTSLPDALARIVTELSLMESPPIAAVEVEQAINKVRIRARQRRLAELSAYIDTLERLDPNDPMVQEWKTLQTQPRASDPTRLG
ncbi:MAG TPA: DNA primase [Armatimonadota bacterium]|jgi:DNA primase